MHIFCKRFLQFLVCGNAQQQFDQLKAIESYIIDTINNITILEAFSDQSSEVQQFEKDAKLALEKDILLVRYQLNLIQEACGVTMSL